ncbi:TetR/AcrR family transcriptional regulator [Listeria sp. PSOL-1]|uniref:TetR/AcrR family transcriptional regulator n=1 Tax=Listeria sp. PSOL-1 TaxID=1844999 RepID=UPI0013D037EA|nr:TetR/AcrR family transcriptional regulator [Listeria sp. PSOL-1]
MSSKQKIIKAAIEVIKEEGIRQYSLARVAARIHITKPAIFYHFKNKEELTLAIIYHAISVYKEIETEEYEKIKEDSAFPYTESYLKGNLRQLQNAELVGLHSVLLATSISENIDGSYWDEIYETEFRNMASEIGAEMAELVRYTIDGMWHAKLLKMNEPEQTSQETVVQFLLGKIANTTSS